MNDEELKKAGLDYFKKTYPSYIGCDKFTEDVVDAFVGGCKFILSQNNDDPYGEYFEDDARQDEVIDESFDVE